MPQPPVPSQPRPPSPLPIPRWSSAELLGGRREVQIEHHGTIYTLRLTALGKLILTK